MYGRGTRIAGRTTVSQKRSYESLFPVDSTATFLLFLPSFFFFLCPTVRERDDLPDKLHFSIVSQSKVPLARLLLPFLPSFLRQSKSDREREGVTQTQFRASFPLSSARLRPAVTTAASFAAAALTNDRDADRASGRGRGRPGSAYSRRRPRAALRLAARWSRAPLPSLSLSE